MSRRRTLIQVAIGVVVAVAVFVGGVLYPRWRQAVDTNRDSRADPHHIAGNLYFVGDPAETSFLLAGDNGHALIGSAGQKAAHKIADNMKQLGFDIKDVRMVLAAGQFDSLAELQQASGAELWASDASAGVIASGGKNNPNVVFITYRLLARVGITSFPPARVDHRVKDNETIRLGSLAITAHVTRGGCSPRGNRVRLGGRSRHPPAMPGQPQPPHLLKGCHHADAACRTPPLPPRDGPS